MASPAHGGWILQQAGWAVSGHLLDSLFRKARTTGPKTAVWRTGSRVAMTILVSPKANML
jgi:hypothetical protein